MASSDRLKAVALTELLNMFYGYKLDQRSSWRQRQKSIEPAATSFELPLLMKESLLVTLAV